MNEELMITKEDLVNWLNRPPSNDDLDLIGFITTRLENFYKLEQENKQLKSILTELEEWLQSIIYEIEPMGCSINYNCEYDSEEDYINAMKEQSKLNTLKIIKDKIQKLKKNIMEGKI